MPIVQIKGGMTEVDQEDYEWAISRPWHLGDTGYVKCHRYVPVLTTFPDHLPADTDRQVAA